METFRKLFGSLLALVYHCFDRIVIQGYLPLLTSPGHVVHFFRDVHGIYPITKEALAKRTNEYRQWVEAFARNHPIPFQWPQKNSKNEDYVRPYCLSMERSKRFGVYFIFKSMVSFRQPCLAGNWQLVWLVRSLRGQGGPVSDGGSGSNDSGRYAGTASAFRRMASDASPTIAATK